MRGMGKGRCSNVSRDHYDEEAFVPDSAVDLEQDGAETEEDDEIEEDGE